MEDNQDEVNTGGISFANAAQQCQINYHTPTTRFPDVEERKKFYSGFDTAESNQLKAFQKYALSKIQTGPPGNIRTQSVGEANDAASYEKLLSGLTDATVSTSRFATI